MNRIQDPLVTSQGMRTEANGRNISNNVFHKEVSPLVLALSVSVPPNKMKDPGQNICHRICAVHTSPLNWLDDLSPLSKDKWKQGQQSIGTPMV